jgi:DNA-binding response OmpR family regulator
MMRRRILLVDDDSEMHLLHKSSLTHLNLVFDDAFDGEEAVRLLRQHNYDLILLDLVMPDVNGFDFLDKAKEENLPLPFVIICSSMREKEIVMAAFKLGASDFLFKPIHPALLRQTVQTYLEILDKTESQFQELKSIADNELTLNKADASSSPALGSAANSSEEKQFDHISKAISHMVFNRVSGELLVSNAHHQGRLEYQNGRLQKVSFGDKSGIDALEALKLQLHLNITLKKTQAF